MRRPVAAIFPVEPMQSDALREFSKIPILAGLDQSETFELIRACKVHRVATGEVLFRQGESTRSMYIIETGTVDVLLERDGGRKELIARFGALDVIGEMSLLDAGPRSATARATSEATLYEIRGEDFEAMLRADSPAAYKVVRSLARIVCKRIRSVNTRIEAELLGAPPPPVHTGEFERVRSHVSGVRPVVGDASMSGSRPAASASRSGHAAAMPAAGPGKVGAGPGRPAAGPGKPAAGSTGVFRKMISKLWGSEDDE